jgi:O-antigen/teichoic acid export membrane protein
MNPRQWLQGGARGLVRAWAFAMGGLAGPVIIQVGYLLAAAHALDVTLFGNFLLLISLTTIALSFAGFGAGGVTLKVVARTPDEAPRAFGRALSFTALTMPALLPLIVVAGVLITRGGLSLWVIIAVGFVELTFTRTTQTCSSLFIGRGEQSHSSLMLLATPVARLFAALVALSWSEDSRFSAFAASYCIAAVLAGSLCVAYVTYRIGRPLLSLRGYRYWDGFTFAATDLNSALQSESDKLLLGLLNTPNAVAVFAIASRLMDGAIMPARALRMSMHSRLFREGESGHHGSLRLVLRMLPLVAGYGALAWLGFVVVAPPVAWVFGPGYEDLAAILPILGALPLLRAITELAAEVFVTSDRPGLQVFVQGLAFLVRIALGVLLISRFGIDGAIATTLVITAATGIVLWSIALGSRGSVRGI